MTLSGLPRTRPRLVVTDLDRTLLRADGTVSEATRKALDLARANGARVVIATGRPPRWVAGPARAAGHEGLVVCANGASIYDPASGEIVRHEPIEADDVGRLIAGIGEAIPGARFASESLFDFRGEKGYLDVIEHDLWDGVEIVERAPELAAWPATKLIVRHGTLRSPELAEALRPVLAELSAEGVEATLTTSGIDIVELSRAGVSKLSAIRYLADGWGIAAAEAIAFGDWWNDVAMIRWAGTGVVVANGHPDVLAEADLVAPSNDEDGVARVLESIYGGDRADRREDAARS
jgi:Cof subfamily protein (haloacid dehalogenase superfamily)